MAKVHLEAGKFGKAACGKANVDTTTDLAVVSCEACQRTEAFETFSEVGQTLHEHTWTPLYIEGTWTTNPDGSQSRFDVANGAECACGAILTQDQWSARSPS